VNEKASADNAGSSKVNTSLESPDNYSLAALPEPYRILGLRLKPFSLGHYLLLQRFDCAFVRDDGGAVDRSDLILGVLVCSMSYSEFTKFVDQKNFLREVAKWGKKMGFDTVVNWQKPAKLFQAYLKAGVPEPDYISLEPLESVGAGWTQNLKITLMTRLGHTEAEALDMPLSCALADYYKLAESEGMIRLLTAEDRAMAEANAKAMEALCPA